tara:strand:- start:4376 stop:4717 length:342 start_codon:yes stop_codon:yes gene_type:complete
MSSKLQSTNLHKNFGMAIANLADWCINPWRRLSLYLILFLVGFFLGSSLGMINGTLALMDPIGAFFTVLFIEILIRIRRNFQTSKSSLILLSLVDLFRLGLLYGLFMEGFKLL